MRLFREDLPDTSSSSSSTDQLRLQLHISLSILVPIHTFLCQPQSDSTRDGDNVVCPSHCRTSDTSCFFISATSPLGTRHWLPVKHRVWKGTSSDSQRTPLGNLQTPPIKTVPCQVSCPRSIHDMNWHNYDYKHSITSWYDIKYLANYECIKYLLTNEHLHKQILIHAVT